MDSEELKRNLTSGRHWLRLLFMVLFALILYVTGFVMAVVVVLQFLFALITGQDNPNLRRFGQSLAQYIYQTLCFLTYNREDKPFPFDDWPNEEQSVVPAPDAKPRPRASRAKSTATKSAAAKKTAIKKPAAESTVATNTVTKGPVSKSGTATKAATKTQAEPAPLSEDIQDEATEKPNI